MSESICFVRTTAAAAASKEMKTAIDVRIGFSTSSGIISRLIAWCTGSQGATHAFAVWFDPVFQQDMILEAWWPQGVIIRRFGSVQSERRIVSVLRPPRPVDSGLRDASEWLLRRYDVGGLFGMLWVLFWRRLGRRVKNPLHNPDSLFCSDAVMLLLEKGGYQGSDDIDPACVDPEALRQWMIATGSTESA